MRYLIFLIIPLFFASCIGTPKGKSADFQVYMTDGKRAGAGILVETDRIITPGGFFKFAHYNWQRTDERGVAVLSYLRDGELVFARDEKLGLSATTNYQLGKRHYELRLHEHPIPTNPVSQHSL